MPLLCFHGFSCCSRGIRPAHYFLILPGRMGGLGAVGWFCLQAGPDPSPDMQMSLEKEGSNLRRHTCWASALPLSRLFPFHFEIESH